MTPLSKEVISTDLEVLEKFIEQYKEIPIEAIIKQDILRLGLNFDSGALQNQEYKTKDYFIFTFDHVPLSEQPETVRFRAPEEIKIHGGLFELLPTVISVRIDPTSPYKITIEENQVVLKLHNTTLAEVEFPPIPPWYQYRTRNNKIPGEIAPVIEWGYLIYLTVFRNCQYFGKDEECAFCDINHNWRQQKNFKRPYTGVKSIEDILEVLSWIDKEDTTAKVYTITGGSVVTELQGKNEQDFYFQYVEAIESHFPNRWLGKMVVQAWEKEDLIRFKEAGIKIYHPNYEVWDKRLFSILCPGKERYIGRDNWIRRIIESTEIFGASNVIPNFVGGVELAKPYGFDSVEEAIRSTQEGLEFFMSHGVVPRFTTWCPEPYTTLGNQQKPPLRYFLELLTVWKRTFEKYKLPVPPGYGEPGRGRAVFSVSAFMDVIGYQGRN
ncbi:MAG: radical SAM protein [Leptospiraceae bacterium]|nr:radical SAM protein [Leptospiraceae bacterium]MDW7975659.1 radical SAM protein [Leptospiraceae bacterium]